MGTTWSLLLVGLGLLLALAGMVVAWRALFADRSRGRPRCPKCWYDMAGLVGEPLRLPATCPECGRVCASAPELFRTRRHWRRGTYASFAALLMLGGGWAALVPARGYLWPVSTPLLMWMMPLSGPSGPAGQEVLRRLGICAWPGGALRRTTTAEDAAAIISRAARGVPGVRPLSPQWVNAYGPWLNTYAWAYSFALIPASGPGFGAASAQDPPIQRAFREQAALPVLVGAARTRQVWPVGADVVVEVPVTHWWPMNQYPSLRWEWRAGRNAEPRQDEFRGFATLTGTTEVAGRVTISGPLHVLSQSGGRPATDTGQVVDLSIELDVRGTVDEVLHPVRSRRLDWVLAQQLCVEQATGPLLIVGYSGALGTGGLGFDGIAVGAKCIVSYRGTPLAQLGARWTIGANRMVQSSTSGPSESLFMDALAQHAGEEGWTATLQPDPVAALAELDATERWEGEITIPIRWGAPATGVVRPVLPPGGPAMDYTPSTPPTVPMPAPK